jgi:trimeric autotransporter adhesin
MKLSVVACIGLLGIGLLFLSACDDSAAKTQQSKTNGSAGQNAGQSPSTVSVSPTTPPPLPAGLTQQLQAEGAYSNGTSQTLSSGVTWTSSNSSVASVDSQGIVAAHAAGTATIRASYGAASGTAQQVVTSATLQSLSLHLASSQIAAGLTSTATVVGNYSDGTSITLTSGVSFSSDNLAAATVVGSGVITAVALGTANISASFGSLTATLPVSVTSAVLQSLSLNLANGSIAAGLTTLISVSGNFSDGTSVPLTTGLTFTSNTPSVVTVGATGTVTALAAGSGSVKVTYGALSATAPIQVTSAVLQSLSLLASQASIAAGLATQLTVTGNYSDETSVPINTGVVFSSGNTGVATVSGSGLVAALVSGTAQITASYAALSATTAITVTSAVLQSLSLTSTTGSIAAGLTSQLSAFGNYSDGTSSLLASGVVFSSSNTLLATVSAAGVVTGVGAGTATITATYGSLTTTTQIAVSSAVLQSLTLQSASSSLAAGLGLQLTVLGNYSDATSVPLTSGVVFSSSNTGVAVVSLSGLVNALAAGSATLSASFGGFNATAPLTVTSAVLQSLTVMPASGSLAAGLTTQVTVTGNYSDGSTATLTTGLGFAASDAALATVNSSGLVTTLLPGTVTITVTYSSLSATTSIVVTSAVLQSISLQATSSSVTLGLTTQITAIGHYSDGSTATLSSGVTYSSSNIAVATVSVLGVVLGIAPGSATVTATYQGMSATQGMTIIL